MLYIRDQHSVFSRQEKNISFSQLFLYFLSILIIITIDVLHRTYLISNLFLPNFTFPSRLHVEYIVVVDEFIDFVEGALSHRFRFPFVKGLCVEDKSVLIVYLYSQDT